jgi:hypothetical protein
MDLVQTIIETQLNLNHVRKMQSVKTYGAAMSSACFKPACYREWAVGSSRTASSSVSDVDSYVNIDNLLDSICNN